MSFNLFKKLNVFNYLSNIKTTPSNTDLENTNENDSLLLSVPLYFYIEFIKTYYKSFLLCFLLTTGVIFAYRYVPNSQKVISSLPWNDLALHNDEISDSTYIQKYNPVIYDEMLKELRRMQQAAANLQIKQQASDRKTLALQQQIQKLQMTTTHGTGILNEEKAQNMIKEALLIYDADKLGLRDYALENLGASILSTPLTAAKLNQKGYVLFGIFNFRTYSNPRIIIQPEVQPGRCFAFEGTSGRIRIKLSNEIFISAVTLEHISTTLLTPEEIMAAPQHFAINGLFSDTAEFGYPLGQFVYSVEGPPRQTFLIKAPKETKPYQLIEFEVFSNHGNQDYTCVYRLRVHGSLANNL